MSQLDLPRSTWLEIDLDQLEANVETIISMLDDSSLLAVVKADAYGHGDYRVSKVAIEKGARGLGVATVDEGVRLRKKGIDSQILVMGGVWFDSEIEKVVKHDLQQTINSKKTLKKISKLSKKIGRTTKLHLNVETGMGRLGILPDQALEIAKYVEKSKNIKLAGIMTHFSDADNNDKSYTLSQIKKFKDFLNKLDKIGIDPGVVHAANSAATIDLPESHFDMVRVGLALYGMYPSQYVQRINIDPIATWKTKIVLKKILSENTDISYGRLYKAKKGEQLAVIPVGYGDGYSRAMTGKAEVLIHGERHPVVGAICMDSSVVNAESFEEGDEVVLMGKQKGEKISPEELAKWRETINYEITTTIGSRVPRCYIHNDEISQVKYPKEYEFS